MLKWMSDDQIAVHLCIQVPERSSGLGVSASDRHEPLQLLAPVPDDDDLREPCVGGIGLLDHEKRRPSEATSYVPLLESTVRAP